MSYSDKLLSGEYTYYLDYAFNECILVGDFLHLQSYWLNLACRITTHLMRTFPILLLCWHYNSLWVLASSIGSCLAPFFSILVQQGFWDPSLQYPALLMPLRLEKVSFLHGDISFVLIRCPVLLGRRSYLQVL